jgi:aspartate aminotransferase
VLSNAIKDAFAASSLIRKMFETGNQLKAQYGADKVLDFSLGNPDVDPPPAFHRVFLKLAKEDQKGSHGYMSNPGFPHVREAVAEKTSREQQVKIDGSHVVMTTGAGGGLNVVFKTICDPGDEVIVSRPYFVDYRFYISNHGGKAVEVDTLPDFNLDIEAIGRALSPKTAGVLINSPNNPSCRVYPAQTIAALADLLREHGKKTGRLPYLVSDEPYRDIVYDGVIVPPILSVYSESIVVNSWSKSLSLPGERIGYIAVSPNINDKDEVISGFIHSIRSLGFINAPALMQRIVAELNFAQVDVGVYAHRRDIFTKILDDVRISYAKPEGTFYLFCEVPPRRHGSGTADDFAFVNHLKDHLILGVPGSGFGKPGWLRFAYCVDEKIIRASAEVFKKAMEGW